MSLNIEEINSILINEFEVSPDAIRRDALIRDELGLDSLDAVDLTVIMEEKTGIKVDPAVFLEMKTLGDLHDLLEKIVEQGPEPAE